MKVAGEAELATTNFSPFLLWRGPDLVYAGCLSVERIGSHFSSVIQQTMSEALVSSSFCPNIACPYCDVGQLLYSSLCIK